MPPENHARQDTVRASAAVADSRIEISFEATNPAARRAIRSIIGQVEPGTVSQEDIDVLEIALAEVFNNIVEHAYQDTGRGQVDVAVEMRTPGMHFTIWDDGEPMPAGRLPGGAPADPSLDAHEQAEGGYGLFMIRQLARKLRYERTEGRNRLSFRIKLSSA
ncbi:MAG: ATP-binding protein [Pseudomonadota bacterium]